jgi:hypothetical protein
MIFEAYASLPAASSDARALDTTSADRCHWLRQALAALTAGDNLFRILSRDATLIRAAIRNEHRDDPAKTVLFDSLKPFVPRFALHDVYAPELDVDLRSLIGGTLSDDRTASVANSWSVKVSDLCELLENVE